MMGIHLLCPRPPLQALPSTTTPSSRLIMSNSRSSLFLRPLPGLKMQTGTARLRLVSRCAADGACEPSPEEDPRAVVYRQFRERMDKDRREYRAALRALGAGSPQDAMVDELEATLFRDEEDKLQIYRRGIASGNCILYKEGRGLAKIVFIRVGIAIQLCATVTANAHLRADASSEMSPETVEQIIRTYVSIFLKTAEDAYHMKVQQDSIISFLDALRGVAAISHILYEDALAAANRTGDSSSNYIPEYDAEALNHEFQCDMKELEMNFTMASGRKTRELWPILINATRHVSIFVYRMINQRKKALAHIQARSNGTPQ